MKQNLKRALKVKVGVSLDYEIVKRIKDLAEKDDRAFSQYVNKVLKAHIESTA